MDTFNNGMNNHLDVSTGHQFDFSLDFLLKETLELTDRINKEIQTPNPELSDFEKIIDNIENAELLEKKSDINEIESAPFIPSVTEISTRLYPDENDQDFLFDLVDQVYEKGLSVLEDDELLKKIHVDEKVSLASTEYLENTNEENRKELSEIVKSAPVSPGLICRLDRGKNTFCIRGFSTENIAYQLEALPFEENKLALLRANDCNDEIFYFEVKTYELAEIIKDQVINRRFPIWEDAVCNISDPGYSWWMDISKGKFEIHFKSHSINRAEKFVKLGPIGDAKIAMMRLNQAHALLRSSFPMDEFSCSEKSLVVSTTKPDHSSFMAFQNIFLTGENQTHEENFPDNSIGRTLYCYFLEIAAIRKFWIEVEKKLS